jgi:hypothetical protein
MPAKHNRRSFHNKLCDWEWMREIGGRLFILMHLNKHIK